MTLTAIQPQVLASDPRASVFVTANAGSGKTSTLVKRVARLLLRGAEPQAILCVTYTKAAAAEMQRRLFDLLGAWAVTEDASLAAALADLDEAPGDGAPADLSAARRLFARALETPGGLKIQTLHAFCEKLLRRFPLEAGVSPGFQVLEDAAAARISAQARAAIAGLARQAPEGPIGRAYRHFAVELDWRSFQAMFATFEAKRGAINAFIEACGSLDGLAERVWSDCGLEAVVQPDEIEAEAAAGVDWRSWRRAAGALATSAAVTDQALADAMDAAGPSSSFAELWAPFSTAAGQPRVRLGTNGVNPAARDWLRQEQARLKDALDRLKAARVARDTVLALMLAQAYAETYDGAKSLDGALDFGDLIERTEALLTRRADAAWVLYKLDGGIDHILLDEAQDTAPDQWAILRALTEEFFAGAGLGGVRGRTLFAVGDEKQSIYSFQGAAPQQLAAESRAYRARIEAGGALFRQVPLEESFRSTPQVRACVPARARTPRRCGTSRAARRRTARLTSGRWRRAIRSRRSMSGPPSTTSRRKAPTRSWLGASPPGSRRWSSAAMGSMIAPPPAACVPRATATF
jgi:ATP-dependent helicase/nuclease subunit A